MSVQGDASTIEALTGAAEPAAPAERRHPWAPEAYDRFLAVAATALLAAVLAALARGYSQWSQVPAIVWAHIATILVALVLTPG